MQRHPILVATLLYILIAVALTAPALLGRASLAPDVLLDWDPLYRTAPPPPFPELLDFTPTVIDLPRDLAFARGLHAGRFDLWNPLASGGVPLWFEQGGALFPLKAVFYLAPSRRTYDLFLTLRLVVAGLGAFLLARRRGLRGTSAFVAGAAFEISGPLVATLPFGAGSAPYLLPWVVLASYAVAERPSLRSAAGAAVALGITASTGHPTLILMLFAAFGAAVVGHAARLWRRPRRLLLLGALAALAVVLGLALAGPSLLPLAELQRAGATYKQRPIGEKMRTLSLTTSRRETARALLASAPLGTVPPSKTAIDLTPAIGTLALFLGVVGMFRRRPDPALVCVALLGVVLALAPPGSSLIRDLPGIRLILPLYAWPLILLAVTQAAGDGSKHLAGDRAWRAGAVAVGVLLVLGLALRLVPIDKMPPPAPLRCALPGLAAAGVWAAYRLARRTSGARVAGAGLAVVLVLEQLLTMRAVALFPASSVLRSPPSPAVEFLRDELADGEARMAALPHLVGYPFTTTLFGLRDFRGYAALGIRRYHDYLRAIGVTGDVLTMHTVQKTRSPLLDLAAVRYFVLPAHNTPAAAMDAFLLSVKHPEASADLPLVYEDERVAVYENRHALPRARIVHRAVRLDGEDAAGEWARRFERETRSAAEVGIADVVFLENDERGNAPPLLNGTGSPHESIRLLDETDPDRLRLEARLDEPGFVVLADTYYPGWEALVDGQPSSVFPADLMFRAVHVGAGAHTVELRYRPRSFRWGLVLFACAAVATVFLLWQGRPLLRIRRPREETTVR